MCANDMRAAAVLAVPFLIRIAADIRHPHRAAALAEVSCPARALHFGVASRDELLLHRAGTRDSLYDGYGVEVTGYPAGLVGRRGPGCDHGRHRPPAAPARRSRPRYAHQCHLRAGDRRRPRPRGPWRLPYPARYRAGPDRPCRAGPRHRRGHPHPPTTEWIRELWRDRAQAPEVRLAAATGWLCLTGEPAPDSLRAAVDGLATGERAHAMDALPWMAAAGRSGETGLRHYVRELLHPEQPGQAVHDAPWAATSLTAPQLLTCRCGWTHPCARLVPYCIARATGLPEALCARPISAP